jgi:gas vesicle protein
MFGKDDGNGGTILLSFLIGGIVGAGLAFLFAPQSGKRTRAKLADMAEDVKDQASDYARKLKDKIA